MFGDVLQDQEHAGLAMVRHDVETAFVDERLALSIGEAVGLASPGAQSFLIPGDRIGKELRS